MEITYSLSREDYWQFNSLLLKRRRGYYLSPIISGLVAGLFCLFLILSDKGPLLPWAAGLAVLAAAGVGVGWVVVCRSYFLRRAVRRLPADDGSTLAKRTVTIDGEGFHSRSAVAEGMLRWSGIREIVENLDYVYLFSDKQVAVIVPKRVFADSATAVKFAEAVRSYWESGKSRAGSS